MKVIGQGTDGSYLFSVSREEVRQLLLASGIVDNSTNDILRDERKILGFEFQVEGIARIISDVVDLQNNYYFKELKVKLNEIVKTVNAFNDTVVAFNEQAKTIDKSRRRKK